MTGNVQVRTLTREETRALVDWAAEEGWNPALQDADAFYAADPEGFIGCFADGVLASGISAVAYDESFGFIGLYITRPDFRGKGYGLRVWDAGLSRLAGRTVGLDGVPAQQQNYGRMGFKRAYGSARWSGILPSTPVATGTRPAKLNDISQIMPLDRIHFPSSRAAFLLSWLQPPRVTVLSDLDGTLAGYAVLRHCLEGCKIGPLFAKDTPTALSLLNACAPAAGGSTVHLDVPDGQREFTAALEHMGFGRGFETARMYLGPPPTIEMSGVFAVTTLELG